MTPHFLSKEINFSPENFLWANSKKNFWPEVPTFRSWASGAQNMHVPVCPKAMGVDISVRVSGFEAGLAVFILCAPRGGAWVFHLRLSSFSSVSPLFLCAPLGACLLPLHLCLLRHCTLGSSSSTSLL